MEYKQTRFSAISPSPSLFFLEGSDRPHFIFSPLEGILLIEFREHFLWAVSLCGVYAYHYNVHFAKAVVRMFESGLCNVAILYLLPLSAFWLRFHLRLLMQMPIKTNKINIRHNPHVKKRMLFGKLRKEEDYGVIHVSLPESASNLCLLHVE